VISPSLDGEVLAVLAGADDWFTAPRITHLLHGRSVEGGRRVLTRLVDEGTVDRQPAGNAILYRLNRSHLAAPSILAVASQREEFIGRLGSALEGWQTPASYAAIFGSAARRDMRIDSDIDLFLVRPDGEGERWDDDVTTLCALASRWTGNDVRPFEYRASQVRSNRLEPVLQDILEEGVTVAGNREWFMREMRVR
jgi:hypothetical protein